MLGRTRLAAAAAVSEVQALEEQLVAAQARATRRHRRLLRRLQLAQDKAEQSAGRLALAGAAGKAEEEEGEGSRPTYQQAAEHGRTHPANPTMAPPPCLPAAPMAYMAPRGGFWPMHPSSSACHWAAGPTGPPLTHPGYQVFAPGCPYSPWAGQRPPNYPAPY